MILSIGNIITLLIVILVLVVYRQLDRNNRSLDKVKRFADKVKDQLSEFVDSKTTELKNLSIELDVHQRTAKEIVKHISNVETGIGDRAKGFEKLSARMNEYDRALADLVQMTGHVEENLKRLHQESEFVDAVGKRIKDAVARMQSIEKSIPELKEEFAKVNEHELKVVSGNVLKVSKDDAAAIAKQLEKSERSVKGFSDYIAGLEARRDAMEAETIKKLEQAFVGFTKNAEGSSKELRDQFEINLNLLLDSATENGKGVTDRIAKLHAELKEEVVATERSIIEKLDAFQERVNTIEQTYQENIRDVADKARNLEDDVFVQLKSHIESRAREVQKLLTNAFNDTRTSLEESRKELDQKFGESRSQITVWQAEIQKLIEDKEAEFTERYTVFSNDVDTDLSSLAEETARRKEEQKNDLNSFATEMNLTVRDLESSLRDRLNTVEELIAEKDTSFRSSLEEIEEHNNGLADDVIDRFSNHVTKFEESMGGRLTEVETKVSDYEADVAYRMGKIEAVNIDIDELEKNLRSMMEKVRIKIETDFDEWTRQLGERREAERLRVEDELASIHESVEEVERGLNDLKSKAYENVSAKLQVFEDDFFADLKSRSDGLNERLEEWQAGLAGRLDGLSEEAEKGRLEVQDRLNAELRERVEAAREAAVELIHQVFATHSDEVDERISRYEGEVDREFGGISEQIEARKTDVQAALDAARSDIETWQEEIMAHVKDAESKIAADVEEIRTEFDRQKEELVANSEEERSRLKSELAQVGDEVARLEADLKKRSTDALTSFRKQYDGLMKELQAKAAELQGEADQRLRDMRTSSQESFSRMEESQKRLSSKIEESYKELSQNLAEIEKKQKDFVAQTKVFNRADTLKVSLTADIDEMKNQIEAVRNETKGLKEVEKNFQKVKKLGDEVSAKLTKFLAEKHRIETMEADFKKLLTISQSVDAKLDQVTGSHDELQSVQAEIRRLETLEKDVLAKYERLEGKQKILETTNDGVDKNFQALETLDEQLKNLKDGVIAIPRRLDDLSQRIDVLAKSKKDADSAVEQLSSLGSLLKDIEARTQNMQQAREWLARTETRLEEISKQADEQVKLLGSLLKDEAKQGKRDKGAPSLTTRDMVTRLAHQGWKVPQIAQATKLSRGEVELILELLPKSK